MHRRHIVTIEHLFKKTLPKEFIQLYFTANMVVVPFSDPRVAPNVDLGFHFWNSGAFPRITVRCPATSPVVNVFAPPATASSRAITLPEQVWSSGLLRRRPRRLQLYQITLVTRRWVMTPLSRLWRLISSRSTSDTSALGALRNRAILTLTLTMAYRQRRHRQVWSTEFAIFIMKSLQFAYRTEWGSQI